MQMLFCIIHVHLRKKHNLNVSIGWEASAGSQDNTSAHYRGFSSGQFHSLNYASEIYKKPTRTEGTSRMVLSLIHI